MSKQNFYRWEDPKTKMTRLQERIRRSPRRKAGHGASVAAQKKTGDLADAARKQSRFQQLELQARAVSRDYDRAIATLQNRLSRQQYIARPRPKVTETDRNLYREYEQDHSITDAAYIRSAWPKGEQAKLLKRAARIERAVARVRNYEAWRKENNNASTVLDQRSREYAQRGARGAKDAATANKTEYAVFEPNRLKAMMESGKKIPAGELRRQIGAQKKQVKRILDTARGDRLDKNANRKAQDAFNSVGLGNLWSRLTKSQKIAALRQTNLSGILESRFEWVYVTDPREPQKSEALTPWQQSQIKSGGGHMQRILKQEYSQHGGMVADDLTAALDSAKNLFKLEKEQYYKQKGLSKTQMKRRGLLGRGKSKRKRR